MLLKKDLDVLWKSYQKARDAGLILSEMDKCNVDLKARYLRSQIREALQYSRRRMMALKIYLRKTNEKEKQK